MNGNILLIITHYIDDKYYIYINYPQLMFYLLIFYVVPLKVFFNFPEDELGICP